MKWVDDSMTGVFLDPLLAFESFHDSKYITVLTEDAQSKFDVARDYKNHLAAVTADRSLESFLEVRYTTK